jgi:hypothetical protein
MKIYFEIATEPTIHAAIAITIVVLSLTALTAIYIILGNPTVSIYCTTILVLILWLMLILHLPVANAVRAPTVATPPPPPISTAKSKAA